MNNNKIDLAVNNNSNEYMTTGTLTGPYTSSSYCWTCRLYYNPLTLHTCPTISIQPTYKFTNDIIIDKVENGYVVTKNGKKYIVTTKEQLLEYIE